ncbi:NADH dehydrogenase [ubiquinone] 1 beta subcomplex subunit 7-like [Watersipora subatra]|uniref:NADH dehydrogenase [ubiquinone] 1 beta subcomplex subunit 7-like n=1 Tax=Watersipora subatra TaxID=2589382 RepID=UPI00355C1A9D
MGGTMSNMWETWTNRENQPNYAMPPTFDPLLGFENGRKPREMVATHEEMEAANVPHRYRDYCAHLYIDILKCRKQNAPWFRACNHEKHAYDKCEYEDWVLRMKEYEREKRLIRKRNAALKEML